MRIVYSGLPKTKTWIQMLLNTDFLIPISMQPNVVDLRYYELLILLDQTI